ncbi:MAG: hypothetical protein K2H19_00965 [Ruminococcus sp.]|nr:hypothetical protein [Ruminococcus sp.]
MKEAVVSMGKNIFYSIVKEYAEALVSQRPDCASVEGAAICAILTSAHDIFAGVTGISLCNNIVQSVPAEYIAVTAMNNAGQTKALQMITLSFADFSVIKPESEGVAIMLESDPENNKCEVFISENESVSAVSFIGFDEVQHDETDVETYKASNNPESVESRDFLNGFDEQEVSESTNNAGSEAFEKMGIINNSAPEISNDSRNSSLGAPADFSSGFDIDESNPFYEPPVANNEVKAIPTIADKVPTLITDSDSSVSVSRTSANESKKETLSKNDLLKQAKKKKKIAKANFGFRKK